MSEGPDLASSPTPLPQGDCCEAWGWCGQAGVTCNSRLAEFKEKFLSLSNDLTTLWQVVGSSLSTFAQTSPRRYLHKTASCCAVQ